MNSLHPHATVHCNYSSGLTGFTFCVCSTEWLKNTAELPVIAAERACNGLHGPRVILRSELASHSPLFAFCVGRAVSLSVFAVCWFYLFLFTRDGRSSLQCDSVPRAGLVPSQKSLVASAKAGVPECDFLGWVVHRWGSLSKLRFAGPCIERTLLHGAYAFHSFVFVLAVKSVNTGR